MASAILTTKGQITIPKNVRDTLHIKTGDRIEFIQISDNKYEMMAICNEVKQLKGIINTKAKSPISIEEMNAAISSMGQ